MPSTRWGRASLATLLLAAAVVVVPGLTDEPSSAAVSPGVTDRVSVGPDGSQADATAAAPSISADGQFVVFESDAAMVDPDENGARGLEFGDQADIYLRDRRSSTAPPVDPTTVLISAGVPQPLFSCSPDALTFAAGGAAQQVTCTVTGGTVQITSAGVVDAAVPGDSAAFTAVGCDAGTVLSSTGSPSCTATISFDDYEPAATYSASYRVTISGGLARTVALSGTGPAPGILSCVQTVPAPADLEPPPADIRLHQGRTTDFDPRTVYATVVCTATGGDALIDGFAGGVVVRNDADSSGAQFDLVGAASPACTSTDRLAAGSSCNIEIQMVAPGAPLSHTGTLTVTNDYWADGNPNRDTVLDILGTRDAPGPALRSGGDLEMIDGLSHRSRAGGLTGRVGRPAATVWAGAPAQAVPTPVEANGPSTNPVISADGRWVAYQSTATNLVANQGLVDPQGADADVFLHDRDADLDGILDEPGATSTILVSGGDASAGGTGTVPSISGDGQRIAFASSFGAVPRVVLWDRADPLTLRQLDMDGDYDLDADTEVPPDLETPTQSDQPSISEDGLHVAYHLSYSSPPTTEPRQAMVVRDVPADGSLPGTVQRVDVQPDGDVLYPMLVPTSDPSISGDGRVVAFVVTSSPAPSQVVVVDRDLDGDGAVGFDPARYDEWFRTVSTTPDGTPGELTSAQPAITADGRYVAFASMADLTGDPQGTCGGSAAFPCPAILMRDLGAPSGSAIELISTAVPVTDPADDASARPAVSSDGRYVAYDSLASNLIPLVPAEPAPTGDTNDVQDVFVRELTPDLVCTPDPADLGAAQVGDTSAPFGITCTNTTFGPLQVTDLAFVGGDAARFSTVADGCSTTVVHQGGACFLSARHSPTSPGALQTTLRVRSDGGPRRAVEDETVVLRGSGTPRPVPPPQLSTDPSAIDFGTRLLLSSTSRTVTVTNNGSGAALAIPSLSVQPVGPDDVTADYTITGDSCTGASLAPGASCTIDIVFRPLPRALGGAPRPAILVINDSAPGAPHLVTLTGRSQLPIVVVNPGVGRGGSVAFVLGTGFPASQPAVVAFDGFAESVLTTSDAFGIVETPLLVMPRSTIGSRFVTVTVAGVTAGFQFLVEPGSVQIGSDTFLIRR